MIVVWLAVNSFMLVVLLGVILVAAIISQTRVDKVSILLHERISELAKRADAQGDELTNLRIKYDPHRRVEALEKWQRVFCSGPKIEACALLGKIER